MMNTATHIPVKTTVESLGYHQIAEGLREKNAEQDFVRCCVAEPIPHELRKGDYKTYLHFGNPYDDDMVPITLPSRVSVEEVGRILEHTVPIREFAEILEYLATCKESRTMAIFEGETSIGKTLGIKTFTQLLWGENCTPLDFYCKGQTDTSQLMGSWVPNITPSGMDQRLREFRLQPEGVALLEQLRITPADAPEFLEVVGTLNDALHLPHNTQWTFRYGAIPKAMIGTKDAGDNFHLDEQNPKGLLLHVQEVGLAEAAIVDTFLNCRGERAKLAPRIQIWEYDGRTIHAGDDYLIVMSTNPPEHYIDRNELDTALIRNSETLRIGHLCEESLCRMAKEIFTFSLPGTRQDRPRSWSIDLRDATDLGKAIASVMTHLHKNAISILKGGESGRIQRILPTLDDFDKVRSRLIREHVMVTGDSGLLEIDIVATLKRAIRKVYMNRLADPNKKQELSDVLDKILTCEDLGREEFRGAEQTRAHILDTLCKEYAEEVRQKTGTVTADLGSITTSARTIALLEGARERWRTLAEAGILEPLEVS